MEQIKTHPISTFLEETEKELINRTSTPRNPYNSLPLTNQLTWGVKPQELMVIGARTSMGKTSFVLQLMLDLIEVDRSIFYMSFEMKPKKILERMFVNKYKIDNIALLKGEFDKHWMEWESFSGMVEKMRVVIGDGFGTKWQELNGFLKGCSVKPDIVIVDYVQGIASNNRNNKDFIDEYIREFRHRLVENDIAGIVVSQLNRTNPDSKSKEPQLHQLKGCIHPDSIVDGRKIKDYYDNGLLIPISSYDVEERRHKKQKPSSVWNTGKKECLEVVLESGKKIIVSEETKFFDGNKWIRCDNLNVGDKICVDSR